MDAEAQGKRRCLITEATTLTGRKYAYGSDIRLACEAMADKFQLRDKTFFGRVVKGLTWDDKNSQWTIATEAEGNIEGHKTLDIKADFVLMGPGLADRPKLPKLTGMDSFKGHSIHSSRWDYNYSGGSPDDVHPTMDKLKDKTIGVLGTGCTAIQIVPEIANWAKHVYVVQRTASSVELRENPPTDPTEFKTRIANKEGWQEDRLNNMTSFVHRVEPLPEKDLVNDELTHWENAYALAGYHMGVTMEEAPAFLEKLHRQDVPHTERIRGQVDTEVKDKETAEKLKFWYPSWCKRPAFKSDWYSSFNNPNVTLIDTDGRGVDRVTENGIVANGKEYPVDLLVFSTGYKVSLTQWSPGARGLMKIKGRDGIDMDEVYENWRTLHACCTHGFPNLFWPGPGQAGFTANQTYTLDYIAKHVAHIITTAEQKMSGERVVIEPTAEACEEWTQKLMSTAAGMAHAGGCLPNYFNAEGDLQREMQQGPEVMMKYARRSPWGSGAINYKNLIEDWRDEGNMKGLDIEIVA